MALPTMFDCPDRMKTLTFPACWSGLGGAGRTGPALFAASAGAPGTHTTHQAHPRTVTIRFMTPLLSDASARPACRLGRTDQAVKNDGARESGAGARQ